MLLFGLVVARVQTRNPYPPKPIPAVRVQVSWGWGTGSPGKPQGYPCQSLIMKDEGNERTTQTTVGKCQELCADLLLHQPRPIAAGKTSNHMILGHHKTIVLIKFGIRVSFM